MAEDVKQDLDPDALAMTAAVIPDAPLGGEIDDYGEQEDAVPFVSVAGFPSHEEAGEVARHLVEHGIGATIVDGEGAAADDRFGVHVLPADLRRAAEVLGLVAPEARPAANSEEPMKLEKGPLPWKTLALIWLAAMIVVPGAAFYLTYLVMIH